MGPCAPSIIAITFHLIAVHRHTCSEYECCYRSLVCFGCIYWDDASGLAPFPASSRPSMPVASLPAAVASRLAKSPLAAANEATNSATAGSSAGAVGGTGAGAGAGAGSAVESEGGLLKFGTEAPPPPLELLRSLAKQAAALAASGSNDTNARTLPAAVVQLAGKGVARPEAAALRQTYPNS